MTFHTDPDAWVNFNEDDDERITVCATVPHHPRLNLDPYVAFKLGIELVTAARNAEAAEAHRLQRFYAEATA